VLNHKLFGLNPLAFSIHGLLWYLLLVVFLVLSLQRVFPAPAGGKHHGAVYVASIVFAVSASHFSTFLYSPARWLLVTAVLPFVIIVFIYLLVYRILGYGTTGQGFYLNPLTDHIVFIRNFPTRFSAILAELFLGVNASAWLDPLQ